MSARQSVTVLCILLTGLFLASLAAAAAAPAAPAGKPAGPGQMCGGIAGIVCDTGLFCRFPVNQCKVSDLAGKCVKLPENCGDKGPKVCGCDDKTYANQCELIKATPVVHEAHKGACKTKKTY